MSATTQFSIGDRVQITDDWFDSHLRGAIGTIIMAHEGIEDLRRDGVYWIEFDELLSDNTDSAEVDAECLKLIKATGLAAGSN